MNYRRFFISLFALAIGSSGVSAQNYGWYTEGDLAPSTRIRIELKNPLDFERKNCPVVISRFQMPIKDLMEMRVVLVDPSLQSNEQPSKEDFKARGAQINQKETNGHLVFHQLDDIDKDGLWDELFFMTDIAPRATKVMYLYIGFAERGWNSHGTHANIGNYSHHVVPFWESENMGWKLWYPTDCDLYGKRKPGLVAYELYKDNIDGYLVPYDDGTDIMTVENSFGGGGICLFEASAIPDSISRPRFTPQMGDQMTRHNFNLGQISDTRYAFEVITNGPQRSMIKVKTFNWKSGKGFYELEQLYTAYRNQNYSTCRVTYKTFLPEEQKTMFGCGIRKNGKEYDYYQKGGTVITIGDALIENPDDSMGLGGLHVEFVGTALVVKDTYNPEYKFIKSCNGNHAFRIPVTRELSYEYMLLAAWSEGAVYNTPKSFKEYVIKSAVEYNNPLELSGIEVEKKGHK
jgi:hypothetical protein